MPLSDPESARIESYPTRSECYCEHYSMSELKFEIEEAFGISLSDDRAEKVVTVGDLYAAVLVATAGKTRNPNVCLSARTFYELRRHLRLHVASGDASIRIMPSTPLTDILPSAQRRRTWKRLANDLNLRFPRLRRPLSVTLLIWFLSGAIAFVCYASIYDALTTGFSVFAAFLAFSLSMSMIFALTIPFATLPSSTYSTLRGLTEQLLAYNCAKLADRHDALSTRDVWSILCLILMEQLGVDREKIVPDAHLVRDLGYD